MIVVRESNPVLDFRHLCMQIREDPVVTRTRAPLIELDSHNNTYARATRSDRRWQWRHKFLPRTLNRTRRTSVTMSKQIPLYHEFCSN
jgi:hypothetical protein